MLEGGLTQVLSQLQGEKQIRIITLVHHSQFGLFWANLGALQS
jgi:hypothetical protein